MANSKNLSETKNFVYLFYAIILGAISIFVVMSILYQPQSQTSPLPYLNTSNRTLFTPYVQNTSLWITINNTVYHYWASLYNYQAGVNPCILRMYAVKNGQLTYLLTAQQVNATIGYAETVQASDNSPTQPEYANPAFSYMPGLSICNNYIKV